MRTGLLLLVAMAAACGGTEPRRPPEPSLPPVSLPDLSRMEPTVQQQLKAQYATLAALTARADAPRGELAAAYGTMGTLLFAAGQPDAAEACYLHAQALAPDDIRWPYYLGHVYMNRPDRPRAIAAFERSLQIAPDDVAALVWLGKVFLDDGQAAQAEARYTRALVLQPQTVAALYGLGQVALARKDYARAVDQFGKVLSADPRASIAHYPLALAYRGLGDTASAEAHLRQQGRTEVGPPDPRMAELRGVLNGSAAEEARGIRAAESGDYSTAVEHFRRGVEIAPDKLSLRYNLARALTLTGETAEAKAAFDEIIRRAPDDLDARTKLAELLGSRGQFQEALAQYREVLARSPQLADARFGYAGALVGLRRYREALDSLTESTKLFPDDARFAQARARLEAEIGRSR